MVALVLIDQVTKLFAVYMLEPVGSVSVIKGVLNFTYVENEGAAFGMLSNNRWVFLIVSTVAIIALLIYMWKFRPKSRVACLAMSMIAAGGIGNMIDRLARSGVDKSGETYYYVVDFIDFCLTFGPFRKIFPWLFELVESVFHVDLAATDKIFPWVFNMADTFICVGCGLLVLCLIISMIKESREKKNAVAEALEGEAVSLGETVAEVTDETCAESAEESADEKAQETTDDKKTEE